MVRRRSTVRFRNGAPAQRINSNLPDGLWEPFRGPIGPGSSQGHSQGQVSCLIQSESGVVDLRHQLVGPADLSRQCDVSLRERTVGEGGPGTTTAADAITVEHAEASRDSGRRDHPLSAKRPINMNHAGISNVDDSGVLRQDKYRLAMPRFQSAELCGPGGPVLDLRANQSAPGASSTHTIAKRSTVTAIPLACRALPVSTKTCDLT